MVPTLEDPFSRIQEMNQAYKEAYELEDTGLLDQVHVSQNSLFMISYQDILEMQTPGPSSFSKPEK